MLDVRLDFLLLDFLSTHFVVFLKVFTGIDEAILEVFSFLLKGLVLEKLQELLETISCNLLILGQILKAVEKIRIALEGIVEF